MRKERLGGVPSPPLIGSCTEVISPILGKKNQTSDFMKLLDCGQLLEWNGIEKSGLNEVLPENKNAGLQEESKGDCSQRDEVELQ